MAIETAQWRISDPSLDDEDEALLGSVIRLGPIFSA
jgi:hypothetical protein